MLFFSATRDSKTGAVFVKIVNRQKDPTPVHIAVSGAKVEPQGRSFTLSAASPNDTNSILQHDKIVPVTALVDGLSADFTITFPPYSITILEMKATNVR
jgi:alpha-N-arabinofuranosidase